MTRRRGEPPTDPVKAKLWTTLIVLLFLLGAVGVSIALLRA
ncbi:MAG: hypothetical protein AAF436_20440 [Myxococcota bacterium]